VITRDETSRAPGGSRHARMGGWRTAFARRAVVVAATAVVLAGCAAQPDLTADDAAAFRERVAAVAERSLAGDYAGATAELALLETAVGEAVKAGALGDDRAARITGALAAVRSDLDAQIAAQQAAEQAAREAAEQAEQAAAAEAARIAAEQAAAEEAAQRDSGGADENGNGKGKGKDKEKGPGKDKDTGPGGPKGRPGGGGE